jgi:hypothetical protein
VRFKMPFNMMVCIVLMLLTYAVLFADVFGWIK